MSWAAEQFFERALGAVKVWDYAGASDFLVEAIKLKPDFAEAWVVRGNIAFAQERPFDALLHFDRALEVKPDAWDAWNNRGKCFAQLGMWAAAEQSFRHSLTIMPAVEPHVNLANMYCTLMRLEEASREYRAAAACDPNDHEAAFNLGVVLLGLGQWEEGFCHYERRWANTPHPPAAFLNHPKWRGEDLAGKTILLYAEQGYGDEIMAARFAQFVAARYPRAKVVLEPRAPFARLARTLPGDIEIVARGDALPPIDYSCPLLDVPMAARMGPADVPVPARYLDVPDEAREAWRARLPEGLNVGLCWSSGKHLSTTLAARRMKSIPVEWLKGLVQPGVNLISLQKPREPVPPEMGLIDWTEELHDLADTAALIDTLDLVISVDTAVAHLAGALGKPVWNFVRFSGYWPWLADSGEKSIWYPSMKLLRQSALGDWRAPIAAATAGVSSLIMEKAA